MSDTAPGTSRRILAGLGIAAVLTLVAGALHFGTSSAVAQFVAGALALAGLAWSVGIGTESVGARFGPAVTGVLQSTLGNLPELFIVIFALAEGEVLVAQASIVGSLLSNALLVLGLAIMAGAARSPDGVMRFHPRLPNDTATLLLLTVFIIAVLGTSVALDDAASDNAVQISVIGAVLLLALYAGWLVSYLRGGRGQEPALEHEHGPPLSFRVGIGVLAAAGVGAAFVSDWFVSSIDPAVEALGISKAFAGLVIVGIAGNAVENVVGIQLAWKRRYDLAISVVKNSVAQIAAFLYPLLVIVSLAFDSRLTFASSPILIVGLTFAALAVWQITGDGEAAEYEGFALVALYVVIATIAWFE